MGVHCLFLAYGIVFLMLAVVLQAGCSKAITPTMVWYEGENYVSSPKSLPMPREQEMPASGARVLNRSALFIKGNEVKYKVDVPVDMADAKLVFRYARPAYRHDIGGAPVKVELAKLHGAGENGSLMAQTDVDFKAVSNWGGRPVDFGLLTVKLGNLTKGEHMLTLTALTDKSNVTIDGFLIAQNDFTISREELDPLVRLKITSHGYVGLRRPSIVVRQDVEKSLPLAIRSFSPAVKCEFAEAALKDAEGRVQTLSASVDSTGDRIKLDVSNVADGEYTLSVQMGHPEARLEFPVLLVAEFINSLDDDIAEIEKALAADKTSDEAAKRCELDLKHIAEFLKSDKSRLMIASETDEEKWISGLEVWTNWVRFPEQVVLNMRKAASQGRETLKCLAAGKDPYEGRFGDVRRAYRSASTGKIHAYRVFVPSAYAEADKVPVVLMLHGAGNDENYFPDLDDGAVLQELDKRGYLAVMPAWDRDQVMADIPALLDTILKEYPKIDPQRMYCTGHSMGGFGTYILATSRPDMFTAVCCVAGTGDVALASKLKHVPVLILHGEVDGVVPSEGARKMAARMKELGQTVQLYVSPEQNHDYKMPEFIDLTLDFFDKYAKRQGK